MKIRRKRTTLVAASVVALVWGGLAGAGVASAAVPQTATLPAFATVSGGSIMGAEVDGVFDFRGIPYGTAERFERSQAASWSGVKKALNFGEVCPNGAVDVNQHEYATPSGQDLVENEDCLNLNVWSTSQDASAKKPVVVWLHGGGLSNGSSGELPYYDGHNFAKDDDAVVVSVNHRLNVLGYLDLSGVDPKYAATSNLGQLDMVDALEWVRENIDQFGGDPANVTIMGQSGGAQKVFGLMAMPAAAGLFDKAVAMSGAAGSQALPDAQAQTAEVLAQLGISTVDELKQVPYDALSAAAKTVGFSATLVVDGDVIPEAPVIDGKFSSISQDIPLLTTNTFGEVIGNSVALTSWDTAADPLALAYRPDATAESVQQRLTDRFGPWKDAIVAEFEEQFPDHDLFDLLYFSTLDFVSRLPNADAKSSTPEGAPVYTALFAWNLPYFGGVVSYHTGGDLPFVFNNADTVPNLIAGAEDEAHAYQGVTSAALSNYLHTGNPGGPDQPWPEYTTADQWTMVFDTDSRLVDAPDRELITMIKSADAGEPFVESTPSPEPTTEPTAVPTDPSDSPTDDPAAIGTGSGGGSGLASTGANVVGAVAAAIVLLVSGSIALGARRRRHRTV
jgi:para-nitrobenzyl esterase